MNEPDDTLAGVLAAVDLARERLDLIEKRVRKALALHAAREQAVASQTGYNPAWKDANGRLSDAGELEFTRLLEAGTSIEQIAKRLSVTTRSVNSRKARLKGDAEYIAWMNELRARFGKPPLAS